MDTGKLHEILQSSPIGFAFHEIITDKRNKHRNYRFLDVNPAFEAISGLKAVSITGKTVSELFPEAEGSVSGWRSLFDKIAAENGAAEFEHHLAHTGKWFKVNAWQTDDNHIAITLTDITAGRQSMEPGCLKDVQQHAFWDNNLFGVMIADKDGNYVDANEEACRMTGYSCEELKSMTLFHLIAPEHIEGARAHFEQIANSGKAYGEAAYFTKSGEKRWWNVVATRLSDDYFLGLHEDITSRKQAEDMLHLREERHLKQNKALLNIVSRGSLFQSDLQQAIAEITEASAELIGTERVSVWLYNDDFSEIKCTNLYNGIRHQHITNGQILRIEEFPAYFACQKKGEVIDAVDVFTDPRTCELPAAYYKEHNIRSMLDTPVWFHDRLGAVLCFEHTGEQRVWTPEDVRLATSMAALLSLCFQNEERRQAEEKLKANQEKLSLVIELAPDAYLQGDKNGNIIGANYKAIEMFGYSKDELLKMNIKDLFPPEVLVEKPLRFDLINAGITLINERQLRKKNGDLIYIEMNSNAMPDGTYQAFIRDVTGRIKAEEALRENEIRFRMVLENMPVLLNAFDHEGNFIVWNNACEEVTGYKASEVIGNPDAMNWMYPDKEYRELMLKKSEDPLNTQNEFNLLTKNGEIRIISWFDTYHYVNIPGWASWGIGIDITERKHAEEQLIASEKKYQELYSLMRLMADNMQDMLWAKNLKKEYIFANNAICANLLNAIDTEEPLGKTDMFFAMRERNSKPENPDWHTFGEICRDSDAITLEEMKPMQFDEFGNVKGKFLYLDVHKAPLYDEQGKLIGVVGSARDVTAAKKAEIQLRKLSRAVEQSPASVVITDPQGTIEYVNPKFTEITGYTLEETVGQNPRILKSGEQSAEMYAKLWKTISSGKEWKGEFLNKKKNGELFWESALITSITNEKGEILHYLAVKEDITESKLQAETIRITKDTYESIFNSVSEAIYVQDENGLFIDVNRGAEIMYGYSRNELIGKSPAEVSAPGMNDLDSVGKVIGEVAQTGISQSFEFWGQRKNGETFPKDVSINRGKYFGEDHIIATARDITERKRTETAQIILYNIARSIHTANTIEELLETIRQDLSRLFDTTNFFVANYNPMTDTLRQLIFRDEMDCFEEWDASRSISGQVVKSGKTVFLRGEEIDTFCKQNNLEVLGTISACWLGVPIIVNKQVIGVMVIQHYTNPEAYSNADMALFEMVAHETGIYLERQMMIDDIIKAKEKAEESDRLKSAFLANMSHEIRTPMNGILGFAELLKEPDLTGARQQKYIGIIEKSGARMLNIIDQIVDISKIEAGLMEVRLSESNIIEKIETVHTFFNPEAEAKGLKLLINHSLTKNEATVYTDSEKLFAILTNLVKNAIKYTDQGHIEIGCKLKGSFLEFYVKDTGIGIPESRQKAIFDRFVQADIEDKMARQGAGLGLTISKAYIEMMGGEIWVESTTGKGSVFFFSLPVDSEPVEKSDIYTNIVDEEAIAIISQLNILIVEDDDASDMLLKAQLEKTGKKIFNIRTGVEAVEFIRNNTDTDLVLMDIRLPELDGHEATRQIRQFNKDVVIIAQTAYGLAGDKEKAIESGCNDYIAKPIKMAELHSLLKKHFD